jgi:hypothetical protein
MFSEEKKALKRITDKLKKALGIELIGRLLYGKTQY